jgi:hypothetical protein
MSNNKSPVDPALLASLEELSSHLREAAALETKTIAAELNVLSLFRGWMAPAAVYGEPIPISYKRYAYNTKQQSENWTYLPEGFPSSNRGKAMAALAVLEQDSVEPLQTDATKPSSSSQYVSDCLYLLKDRRWALVERVGVFSEEVGSNSQWDGQCRLVTDRFLVGRYTVSSIAEGLLASANIVLSSVGSRMDGLKARSAQVEEFRTMIRRFPDVTER